MWWIIAALVILFLIFKFLVKPVLKILALVVLAGVLFWLLNGSLPWHW